MMNDRDVVFVLGNPRTGSFALTRVLSLSGCTLPDEVVAPGPANERGFWEPMVATRLMLEFLIAGVERVRAQNREGAGPKDDSHATDAFVGKLTEFLMTCPPGPSLLIKEPLICDVLPYWIEAAGRAALAIKVIVCVRHPNETLSSLGCRDAASRHEVSLRWLKVNLALERETRHLPRVFVEYSNLMRDWRNEMNRVSRSLQIDLQPNAMAINAFLTPDLTHHRNDDAIEKTCGHAWVSNVYAVMSAIARDEMVDFSKLDDIHRSFLPHSPPLGVVPEELLANSYERCRWHPVWKSGSDF
jgi:hypothetical protein